MKRWVFLFMVRKEGFGALCCAVLTASGGSAVLATGRPLASRVELRRAFGARRLQLRGATLTSNPSFRLYNRVGGEGFNSPSVLSHHRAYGSVHGGSYS